LNETPVQERRAANESIDLGPVDPSIKYPSYRSFDEFLDVERLRSLDSYVRERIKRRILENDDPKFYTGPYTIREDYAGRPGSRMIYLSESSNPDSYFDLDKPELWQRSESANEFALLLDFIGTLPFETTGRMLIMYDDQPREVPAHRDHTETEVLHQFIWFRTNLNKPFYMLNFRTGEKLMVESYSAWFDTVNQFHGSSPAESLAFSIRVDGIFTKEFLEKIPKPELNPASTPSYWACQDEQGEKR
jgi:hypothetical protein